MEPQLEVELSFPASNCKVINKTYGDELLHIMIPYGNYGWEQRAPVYQKILEDNKTGNFFYLIDNRGGYEIQLSMEDMNESNDLFVKNNIHYCRGAVVSNDEGYKILISMARARAKTNNFNIDLQSTSNYAEAEEFVLSKLLELQ